METFPAEKPIEHLVRAGISSSLVSSRSSFRDPTSEDEKNAVKAGVVNEPHPDLMYGSAILVSTNMNDNDDVFLPEHTWEARHTPTFTPYNDEHKSSDILGHIIASRVLDKDGEIVDSDEMPDDFDIEVDFVVYKSIFPEKAAEIADGFENETKFVSMECRIDGFDYALVGSDEQMKIVERNEDTAFLSKYLRVYGGSGDWRGYTVGRVLKDLRFVGMGNVDTPANKESVYTNIENFDIEKASVKDLIYYVRSTDMKLESLEQASELIDERDNKIKELEKQVAELANKDKEQVEAEKSELEEKLQVEKSKVSTAEQAAEKAEKEKSDLEQKVEDLQGQLDEKKSELDKIHSEKKLAERLAKLDELGISYEDDEKESLASLSDSSFNEIVKYAERAASKANSGRNDDEHKNEAEAELNSASEDEEGLEENAGSDNKEDDYHETAGKLVAALRNSRRGKNKKE